MPDADNYDDEVHFLPLHLVRAKTFNCLRFWCGQMVPSRNYTEFTDFRFFIFLFIKVIANPIFLAQGFVNVPYYANDVHEFRFNLCSLLSQHMLDTVHTFTALADEVCLYLIFCLPVCIKRRLSPFG